MANTGSGITIPVGLEDRTRADAAAIMGNLTRTLPGALRMDVELKGEEGFNKVKSKIEEIAKAMKSGMMTVDEANAALRQFSKNTTSGNALARQAEKVFETFSGGIKRVEQMQAAFTRLREQVGKGVNFSFVDKTFGTNRFGFLDSYFKEITSALKSADFGKLEHLMSKTQTDLFNAAMTGFKTDVYAFKKGNYASQDLLTSLGLPDQKAYDDAVNTFRSQEKVFMDRVQAIMEDGKASVASKRRQLRDVMSGKDKALIDPSGSGTIFDLKYLKQEAGKYGVAMKFDEGVFSALETAMARMRVIAQRKEELKKLGFSDADIKQIMDPYKKWQKAFNDVIKSGNIGALPDFNVNGLWGQSRKSSLAVERSMNEQLFDVKARTKMYEKQAVEFSKLQEEMNKLQKKATKFGKDKGVDMSSFLDTIQRRIGFGISVGNRMKDVDRRNSALGVVRNMIKTHNDELDNMKLETDKLGKARALAQNAGAMMSELNWIKRAGEETPATANALKNLTERVRDLFAAMRSGDASAINSAMDALKRLMDYSKQSIRFESKYGQQSLSFVSQAGIGGNVVVNTAELERRKEAYRKAQEQLAAKESGFSARASFYKDEMSRSAVATEGLKTQIEVLKDVANMQLTRGLDGYGQTVRQITALQERLNSEAERFARLQDLYQKSSGASRNYRKAALNADVPRPTATGTTDNTSKVWEQEKYLARMNAEMKRAEQVADARAKIQQQLRTIGKEGKETEVGRSAIQQLQQQIALIDRLQASIYRANKISLDANASPQKRSQAEADARRYREELDKATASTDRLIARTNAMMVTSGSTLAAASQAAQQYQASLDRVTQAHQQNYGIVSQLRQELITLWSVQQVRQFLSSIIEIGGQFEQQRKSIAAILDDSSKAGVLFEQVKGLGLHSNFTTLELDKYVKELSAFDIEYNQLFDKMKKLADISAGTGTDMSRIILAYGHVKAAGYLEGMQRRQFTNANIPIVKELQKLYSEREKRGVSSADVYKRISNKQVSAADVDEVLMKMAEPGGKFYNMQEVMADTTKGVWKNLGDAWNHMLLALNEQFGGLIMSVGKGLTSLTRIIGQVAPALLPLVSSWLILSRLRKSYNNVAGQGNAQAIKDIRTAQKQRLAELERIQSIRALTAAEKEELAVRRQGMLSANLLLGGDGARAATDRALVGMRTGNVRASEAREFVISGGVSRADAIRANKGMAAVLDGKRLASAQYAWYGFTNTVSAGLRAAGSAAWGFMKSLGSMFASFLPFMVIEGIIGGISYMMNKSKEEARESKEAIDMVANSLKNLKEALHDYRNITKREQVNGMTRDEIVAMEKSLITAAKDELGGSANVILNDIYKTDKNGEFLKPQIDRAFELKVRLEEAVKELEKIKDVDYYSDVTDAWNSWNTSKGDRDLFGGDMETQLGDYASAIDGVNRSVAKMSIEEKDAFRMVIKSASAGVKGMDAFRDSTGKLNDNLAEQYMYLVKIGKLKVDDEGLMNDGDGNRFKYRRGKEFKDYYYDRDIMGENRGGLVEFYNRVQAIQKLEKQVRAEYGDAVKNATDTQYREMVKNVAVKVNPEVSPKAAADFADLLTHLRSDKGDGKFTVPVTPYIDEDIVGKIDKDESWKTALKEYFGNNVLFSAAIEASPNLASAQEACQKLYDELWSNWEKLKASGKAFDLDINVNLSSGNAESVKSDIEKRLKDLRDRRSGFNINSMMSADEKTAQAAQTEWNKINGQIQVLEEMLSIADAMFNATAARKDGFLSKPKGEPKPKNERKKREDTRDKGLKNWDSRLDAIDALQDAFEKAYDDYGEAVTDYLALDDDWKKAIEDVKKLRGYKADYDLMSLENGFYKWKKDIFGEEIPNEGGELDKDAREKAKDELLKDIKDFERNRDKDERERGLKAVDRYIESAKGRVDMYYRILDAMYDKEVSERFAFDGFVPDFDVSDLYIYEEVPRIVADFNRKMEKEVDALGGGKYTYGMLKERGSLTGVPMRIAEEFLAAQKQIEDIENAQKDKLVEIIGNYRTAYDQLLDDRAKFERDMAMVLVARDKDWISADTANALRERMIAMQDKKELEASYDYYRFFLESTGVFDSTLDGIGKSIKDNLAEQMRMGVIEAKDYYEQLQKVDDVLKKNRDAGRRDRWILNAFGVNGSASERNQRALDDARRLGDDAERQIRESAWYKSLDEATRRSYDGLMMSHGLRPWEIVDSKGKMDDGTMKAIEAFFKYRGIQDKREAKSLKYDKMSDAASVIGKVNRSMKELMDCFGAFKGMMDALGYDMESETALQVEAGMNALMGFGDAAAKAASGDYFGAAVGAVTSVFKTIEEYSKINDTLIDKENEKLQDIIEYLESVKSVSQKDASRNWGVYGEDKYTSYLRNYYASAIDVANGKYKQWVNEYNVAPWTDLGKGGYKRNATSWKNTMNAMQEAYDAISGNTSYSAEYNAMLDELKRLQEQRANLFKKNKGDADEIKSKTEEILNLLEEIDVRSEEIAKDMFGIDFRGWASQLTDAMVEAFTNGEDAALKWEQTVDKIVRDVAKNITNKMVTEAMMEPIFKQFLDYNIDNVDGRGKWRNADGSLNFDAITNGGAEDLYHSLSELGQNVLPAIQSITNDINGLTWAADSSAGGSLTKLGQSLTEETGSVMAGYLNGINGNVTAMRTIADSQLRELQVIAGHTAFIAAHIEKIAACSEHMEVLTDVVNGTKAFTMK